VSIDKLGIKLIKRKMKVKYIAELKVPPGGFRGRYSRQPKSPLGDLGVDKFKMKSLSNLLLLGFAFIIFSSCQHNRLKTNEKELAKEIKAREKEKKEADRIALEELKNDTLANLPTGFRYKEDRSVDPAHPPIVIDLSGDIPVREIKLSDISSRIKYIVLEVPDDSVFFYRGSILHFAGDNIIANNNMGINRFSGDGRFLETICKSSFNGPRITNDFTDGTFRGTYINNVYTAGTTVYYKYSDTPEEKVSLVKFTIKDKPSLISIQSEEGQPDTYAKGDVIDMGKIGSPGLGYTNIFAVSDNMYAGMPPNLPDAFGENSILMVTFNSNGDTLCKFKQHDLLENPVTSTLMRSFSNLSWFHGEVATFKWLFNDTVYRLKGPNRLVPAYIFKLGDHKITVDDWLHVSTSLNGKILIGDILESQRYLFIDYRYYDLDNPKVPVVEKAIYVKETKDFFRIALSQEQKKVLNSVPPPPRPGSLLPPQINVVSPGLENDLDGGRAFWPQYVTTEGSLATTVSPEVLLSHIQNTNFKKVENSVFPDFVRSLKTGGKQTVIIIVE
jgi:hypothetical protein